LEDKESLVEYFDCEKYVKQAEEGVSRIYSRKISGNKINIFVIDKSIKKRSKKLEGKIESFEVGKSGSDHQPIEGKVKIVDNHF
jgi:hypothetical protein